MLIGISIRPYDQPEAGVSVVGSLVGALVLRHRVLGVDETGECQRRFSYDVTFGFGNEELASGGSSWAVAGDGAESITRTPLLRRLERCARSFGGEVSVGIEWLMRDVDVGWKK